MRSWKQLQSLALALGFVVACDSKDPTPTPSADAPPAAPSAPVDTWVTHTDELGGFTVRMPGKPTVESTKVPTVAGDLDMASASYEVPGRDVYMAATWSPLPPLLVEVGDTEKMLDDGVDGMVKSINASLDGAPKHIELDHHPGREIRLTAQVEGKTAKARARMFVVHDRLFQMLVVYEASEIYETEIDKLFASFALTPDFAAKHAEVVKFEWQPFKSADGKFTAKFPVAAPRVETETQKVGDNEFQMTTITGSALQSYAVFTIGYFDVPGGVKKQKPEEVFALGRDGAATAVEAKLVGTAEPSPLGKLPGEKYKLESKTGLMTIDGRSYLAGNRFYFLMALRPRNSKVEQAELDTFFAGFEPAAK